MTNPDKTDFTYLALWSKSNPFFTLDKVQGAIFLRSFLAAIGLIHYYNYKIMTKSDILFAQCSKLINTALAELKIHEMEKMSIRIATYDMLQKNYAVEGFYYDLVEYIKEHDSLYKIIPEIKKYYTNL